MKLNLALLAAFAAEKVASHATFQALWVNGVDTGAQCARLPSSNSPITSVSGSTIRCNAGQTRAASKCPVKAGDTVTVEMHQQNGERGCSQPAIGGAHYGPVMVYMSKVSDAYTADGSTGFFKIYQDSWAANPSGSTGDDDFWGVKDMEKCCGRISVKIPSDIPAGDYLLRAEVIALHSAASVGGAQFYVTCYQLTVSGGGSASPPTVNFPGAYNANDPGIAVNIHGRMSGYTAPGPTVYSGGTIKSAGGACAGCEATCTAGAGPSTTLGQTQPTGGAGGGGTGGGGGGGCSVAQYGQCGGEGYTGCTTCGSGKCVAVSPPYYSQCQ
jgi:cellulase